jgi:arylformamidase
VQEVKKEQLVGFEEKIKKVKAVIIETGFGEKILQGKEFEKFSFLSKEAAEFLAKFDLNIVGIDSFSIDKRKVSDAHKALLGKEILLLEVLVNLDKVPEEFFLASFPLKVKNSDGAPTRAVAFV